jgi:hypothetical protein
MNTKPNIALSRRQLLKIEKEFYAASRHDKSERARKLGRAADLLVEIRACELHRLR